MWDTGQGTGAEEFAGQEGAMAVIGKLLKNVRADEARSAWNQPNLSGPETLTVTSVAFKDGAAIPLPHAGRRLGGVDLSPQLAWSAVPAGTESILLVVEDLDSPFRTPIVHAVALIDPAVTMLDAGALAARSPGVGVRVLRSFLGRGYRGPGPIAGHGPHRYVFQVFALGSDVGTVGLAGGVPLEEARPRTVLAAAAGPVLARGRLTGTYER
jgi:phosphatidylethanolamine-binding protein (PEBP) family uncharacterized protein